MDQDLLHHVWGMKSIYQLFGVNRRGKGFDTATCTYYVFVSFPRYGGRTCGRLLTYIQVT